MPRLPLPKEMIVAGAALIGLAGVALPLAPHLGDGLPWHAERPAVAASLPTLSLVPYEIDRGLCDRTRLTADLAAGPAVVARGGIASTLVSGAAGARMDVADQHCVGRVLEFAPDSRRVYWRNGNSGFTYAVVPARTFRDPTGVYCREYHASASQGPLLHQAHAIACRRANGSWRAAG